MRGFFICIVFMCVVVSSASAQPVSPELTPAPHPGLFVGGGLWGGNISCEGSNCSGFRAAGGANGQIGWMFSRRLGVLFDFWAMTSSNNGVGVTFLTSTIDLRYWLLPILWVQAGLGEGHALIHVGALAAAGGDVPVGEISAGLELARGRNWDIDVALQLDQGTTTNSQGGANTGRSTGLGVHLTFYPGR